MLGKNGSQRKGNETLREERKLTGNERLEEEGEEGDERKWRELERKKQIVVACM